MKKINKANVRGGVSLDKVLKYLRENKRKTMMTVVLIMAVFVVLLNSSFGYFKKRIEGTKLTFNVGTLKYELECVNLENCEVVIPANSSEVFNVNLTSLNSIETKYELYYEVVNPVGTKNSLNGGHSVLEDTTQTYLIKSKETKNIDLVINNTGSDKVTIKLGVAPSLKSDSAELAENQISLNKEMYQKYYVYDYTGDYETFIANSSGEYKIELWGAQGASVSTTATGGAGSYTSGTIELLEDEHLYLYIGEAGSTEKLATMSFNGGGNSVGNEPEYYSTGGGATDVRLIEGDWDEFESLKSRIMVAAGGGGAGNRGIGYGRSNGGPGGKLVGLIPAIYEVSDSLGNIYGYAYGTGGTQTSGGEVIKIVGTSSYSESWLFKNSLFGMAAPADKSNNVVSSGGGGGYYGGGGGRHVGGSGGSSFISGYDGCNAITENSTSDSIVHTGKSNHYSGKIFSNTLMIAGNELQPTHDLIRTMIGNGGHGYARITFLGSGSYTIKYDANGGEGIMEADEVLEYDTVQLSKNKFTKEGYGFVGWSLSPDSNKVVYNDLDNITNLSTVNEEITLYAVWTKELILTFDATGGNIDGGISLTNLITNGSFEKGSTSWTLENAEVTTEEKYTGSNSLKFSVGSVTSMSLQTLKNSAPTMNHKYYGRTMFLSSDNFTALDDRFEWSFNDDIQSGNLLFALKNIQTSSWINLSSIQTQRSSTYLDDTWRVRNFLVYPSSVAYVDDMMIIDLTESYGSGKEPIDTSVLDTISYFENTSSIYQKSVTINSEYGEFPTPTRIGYAFNGWYTKPNGGSQITSGTQVSITSNQTLYARWVENSYEVTLDANGGFMGDYNEVSSGHTSSITLAQGVSVPVIEGQNLSLKQNQKYLLQFNYKSVGNNTFNVDLFPDDLPEVVVNATTNLQTYNWIVSSSSSNMGSSRIRFFNNKIIPNPYNIYISGVKLYECTNCILTSSYSATYGSTYGTLPTPTRTGYTFDGWYTSASGGTEITSTSIVSIESNQTLYAHWTANRVYVYNYGNESSFTGGFSIKNGLAAINPSASGWTGIPTIVANSNNLQISIPNQSSSSGSNGNMCGMWHTINKIDLTNYSKLYALVDIAFGNTYARLSQISMANIRVEGDGLNLYNSTVVADYTRYNEEGSLLQKIVELDISSVTGSYYISFYLTRDLVYTQYPNNNMDFKIYSVWLEE